MLWWKIHNFVKIKSGSIICEDNFQESLFLYKLDIICSMA